MKRKKKATKKLIESHDRFSWSIWCLFFLNNKRRRKRRWKLSWHWVSSYILSYVYSRFWVYGSVKLSGYSSSLSFISSQNHFQFLLAPIQSVSIHHNMKETHRHTKKREKRKKTTDLVTKEDNVWLRNKWEEPRWVAQHLRDGVYPS